MVLQTRSARTEINQNEVSNELVVGQESIVTDQLLVFWTPIMNLFGSFLNDFEKQKTKK